MKNDFYDYVERRMNQRKGMLEKMKAKGNWFRFNTAGYTFTGKIDSIDMDILYLKPSIVCSESNEGLIYNLEKEIPSIISTMEIVSIHPIKEADINYWLSMNKKKDERTGFGVK